MDTNAEHGFRFRIRNSIRSRTYSQDRWGVTSSQPDPYSGVVERDADKSSLQKSSNKRFVSLIETQGFVFLILFLFVSFIIETQNVDSCLF